MMSVSDSAEESGQSTPGRDSEFESRGSSVSTGLREEYEDLLRYAIVAPTTSGMMSMKGGGARTASSASAHATAYAAPFSGSAGRRVEMSKVESDEEEVAQDNQAPPTSPPMPRPPLPVGGARARGTTTEVHSHDVPPPPPPAPPSSYSTRDGSHRHDNPTHKSHDHSGGGDEGVNFRGLDPDMTRLDSQLDVWCLDLKRNVLAEFEQSRARMIERLHAQRKEERQHYALEMDKVREELERCKELVVTYEQSIGRKDQIITNLTRALQKERDRVELQKSFGAWKLRHVDEKREVFASALARSHFNRKVSSHVFTAWCAMVKSRWKQRVEKACQIRAEEVCVKLTNEYEEQLNAVRRSLDESRDEACRMKSEKDLYEENMKKAFMRGVCALNLEAMSLFHARSHGDGGDPAHSLVNGGCGSPPTEGEQGGLENGNEPASTPQSPQSPNHRTVHVGTSARAVPHPPSATNSSIPPPAAKMGVSVVPPHYYPVNTTCVAGPQSKPHPLSSSKCSATANAPSKQFPSRNNGRASTGLGTAKTTRHIPSVVVERHHRSN